MPLRRTIIQKGLTEASLKFAAEFGVSKSAARAWCSEALCDPEVQAAICLGAHRAALRLLTAAARGAKNGS